jgi:hypothetical protein
MSDQVSKGVQLTHSGIEIELQEQITFVARTSY